jgi:hypothetical protein
MGCTWLESSAFPVVSWTNHAIHTGRGRCAGNRKRSGTDFASGYTNIPRGFLYFFLDAESERLGASVRLPWLVGVRTCSWAARGGAAAFFGAGRVFACPNGSGRSWTIPGAVRSRPFAASDNGVR